MSSIDIDIKWLWIAPEIVLTVAGLLALLVAAMQPAGTPADDAAAEIENRKSKIENLGAAEIISIFGVACAGILALTSLPDRSAANAHHFWGMMTHDGFSAFFKAIVALAVLLVMAMTAGYRRHVYNRPEVYGFLTLATLAIFFMASASELVMIFLAIEFLSIVSYVLVGFLKDEPRSAEAGIKYFLFGAVCAAVMLYGMSFLYGMTGTTVLREIGVHLSTRKMAAHPQIALIAMMLILAGLGFKISMVPFQQWVPDAYEGAPTPITAFLSVASKAAGFAVALRILGVAFGGPALAPHWAAIIGLLAMLTMTWGNTAAIGQSNMKRMLAYSSIAQAGYLMVGLVAAGAAPEIAQRYALPGILLYLLVYLFMNLGAFAVVIAVANQTGSEEIPQYAGLCQRAPWLAALLSFFLLSLIGIPPTAGFIGKMYLFMAAINGKSAMLNTLAIVMIVNSVISAFYYLNVVRCMYFQPPAEETPLVPNRPLIAALAVTAVATLALGVSSLGADVATAGAHASALFQGIMALSAAR